MTHKMVPVEPTREMLCAGTLYDNNDENSDIGADVAGIYKAMLSAAPPADARVVYQCPRCATAMEVDLSAKPSALKTPAEQDVINLGGQHSIPGKPAAQSLADQPTAATRVDDTPRKSESAPESRGPEPALAVAPDSLVTMTDEEIEKIRQDFIRAGCDSKELHALCNQAIAAIGLQAEVEQLKKVCGWVSEEQIRKIADDITLRLQTADDFGKIHIAICNACREILRLAGMEVKS